MRASRRTPPLLSRPALSLAGRLFVTLVIAVLAVAPAQAETFRSDSKRFGNPKMDIVLTETERLTRTSIVDIQITAIGSSVGSSFFLLCSLRDLARQRGPFRYLVKTERVPRDSQMLVGFLNGPSEEPAELDPRLAGQPVIDLDDFAPICDKMN
ncbi:MAG: hypothetical protein Q7U39_09095 [Nitrospira sp.]|nr:hypothetical protein [Nitrospira sp.]